MNKWEKELAALELKGERSVLNAMKGHYQTALERVYGKIDACPSETTFPVSGRGVTKRRSPSRSAES